MNWYYAVGEERRGPLGEADFQQMVAQGIIKPDTLVWREGMAAWEPWSRASAPVGALGTVVCAGCGGQFGSSEVVDFGGGAYCANCKPLGLQRLREGAASAPSAVEQIRKDHLKHEASLQSVGVLYYLGGTALIILGMVGFTAGTAGANVASMATSAFFLAIGVCQIVVGTGLRRLRTWARIPSGILSGIALLGFPIGTLINGYVLYLLFSAKGRMVLSEEYRAVIEQTPHIKYRTSIVVWILLILLILIVGFAILAAFLIPRR